MWYFNSYLFISLHNILLFENFKMHVVNFEFWLYSPFTPPSFLLDHPILIPSFINSLPSSVCAAHRLGNVGPSMEPWSAYIPAVTLLKKPDSFFPSTLQLPMVPQLGVRAHEALSIHAGMLLGLILGRSCADNHSRREYKSSTLSGPRDILPPQSFLTSSRMVPEPCGGGEAVIKRSHLWPRTSQILILCPLTSSEFLRYFNSLLSKLS